MPPVDVDDLVLYIFQIEGFRVLVPFSARSAFVRTNRRAIATMFAHLSVCLSVWDGRAL